jgi:methyl-CpG-binding domain protein 4
MIPPRSGYGLIQEDLWPDGWKILVSCVMLNCTSRKQVEKVLPRFFALWPGPEELLDSNPEIIAETIAPLGFKNRRTKNLLNMSRSYLEQDWKDPRELPGVGEYGARAWEIFCGNKLGDEPPKDGALVLYWQWRKKHDNRT